MRIVHVVPAISNEASGPSYSVVRLCDSVIEQGQDVTLAALDWAPMESPPSYLETFPLGWGPRRLGRSPGMQNWLTKQADFGSVDLLHNHSLWMMPNVYPGRVARLGKVPLVVSPRGTLSEWAMRSGSSMKRPFWYLLQRPALSGTRCFHATAESEYEDIRRAGFDQPVAIIPNGIDIPRLKKKVAQEYRTLLFLGRIHQIKGLDLLLSAWKAVQERHPEWRLRIVGPDNRGYLEQMRRLSTELRLERVEFSGALYGDRKIDAYQEAGLFVLPTYSENFGIAVAEALACGLPAIVSKGAPWAGLEDNGAGWWIDIGLDSLVTCLDQVMDCPSDMLANIGQRGREWMKTALSWQTVSKQMAETYRWIVFGGDRPEWVVD